MAMAQPGMFLSQPPTATKPSKPCRAHDGLDRIGNHLARHQRVAHAGRSHGDAVGDRDGVEQHALAAGRVDARRGLARQLADVHVAGGEIAQVEATPICGLVKSSSRKPTARSMARAGAWRSPSNTTRE